MTSGIRLGTPALTTRGLKEEDMIEVADIISLVLKNPQDVDKQEEAKARVEAIALKYPLY